MVPGNMKMTRAEREAEELWEACTTGDVPRVRNLLSLGGINVNYRDATHGRTPFYRCCGHGHADVVELLLRDPRVDVNLPINQRATPFYVACQEGHLEVVRLLLDDKRVEINQPDADGTTPLWFACQKGRIEVVKWLICSGREVDCLKKSNKGAAGWNDKTPLEIARWSAMQSRVFKYETQEESEKRRTGCNEIVQVLQSFSANPTETRRRIRNELKYTKDSANLLVCGSLLAENLVEIKGRKKKSNAARFLKILSALHFDLQQILCNRSQGFTFDFIPDREIQTSLAHFLQKKSLRIRNLF